MRLAIRREEKEGSCEHPETAERRPEGDPDHITRVRERRQGDRPGRGRALGYRYVDRESILADIRKDGPKWEQWAGDLDEHCPTVWEKYDWSYRGFAALMQLHILEHAQQGGVVIMGRGGNFVLKDVPHAYRIRVTAPLEVRMERIVKREGVDRDTARWLCEKTDSERACFLHAIYGGQWDDPAEYDRVFSVTGQSVDAEVAAITEVLKNMPVAGRPCAPCISVPRPQGSGRASPRIRSFLFPSSTYFPRARVLSCGASPTRRRSTSESRKRPGSLPAVFPCGASSISENKDDAIPVCLTHRAASGSIKT